MQDVHKLRVFEAVAQYLSFTRAAQGLFLTQSAVSHTIAALEQELNTPLFRREGKRVSLTEPGRVLREHARKLFAALEEATAAVKRAARPELGILRIGASPAACQYLGIDGIGANEYLVDVAHGTCDFISTVDTPANWELNIWYHTLNCGYRCRISGETDFPCIYGERVGLGRSYVHLDGKLKFEDWAEGIKDGRCYVSDGLSHLMDFSVNGQGVGLEGSEVTLKEAGKVKMKANVAALLEPEPTPETERIRNAPPATRGNSSYQTLVNKPYWHVERARVGNTRKVPVELVVNGRAVAKKEITADGSLQEVEFEVPLEKSSWVCLRIFPSSHTNPVFVLVGDKPIRASKKSAEWCLKGIDKCWDEKVKKIRESERGEALKAYDRARDEYKKILAESAED